MVYKMREREGKIGGERERGKKKEERREREREKRRGEREREIRNKFKKGFPPPTLY